MHESTPNDLIKPKHDQKSTLDILADASVVEEESKESFRDTEAASSVPVDGPTSSAVDGDGTAEEAQPMQIDSEEKPTSTETSKDDGDVVMGDAEETDKPEAEGRVEVQQSSGATEAAKPSSGEHGENGGDEPRDDSVLASGTGEKAAERGGASSGPDPASVLGRIRKDEGDADTIAVSNNQTSRDIAKAAYMGTAASTDIVDEKKGEESSAEPSGEDKPTVEKMKDEETETAAATTDADSAEKEPTTTVKTNEKQSEETPTTTDADSPEKEPATTAEPVEEKQSEETPTPTTTDADTSAEKEPAATAETNKKQSETPPKTNGGSSAPRQEKTSTPAAAVATTANPPPPVMKGTLSFDTDTRRHLIRGMWNYENSNVFPPQRFELLRNLNPGEDLKELPKDGEFHGSFSLAYFHTTSKGKQKERSKVIPESGVNIKFTEVDGKDGEYKVDGKGTNQFGIFHINGTATRSKHEGDPTLYVVLRKRYEPSPNAVLESAEPVSTVDTSKKSTDITKSVAVPSPADSGADDSGPLPPPSKSFPSGVVCLRGQLRKEKSQDLGSTEVVHRISGMWSSGLDFLVGDPQNTRGLCNRFEYEHKSSVPSHTAFPVSGRYSGWFDLSNEDGSRTRINERDVTLKFRKNNVGGYNVEGKGSNVFGKYSITGTLTKDSVLTIFRHFQPRKIKASSKSSAAPGASVSSSSTSAPGQARRPSLPAPVELKLKMDDVRIPGDSASDAPLEPIKPPANTTYSAVSRGILRVNEDGSHSCQGKWAITREHFTNGQTSNFNFRLEQHYAKEAAAASKNGNGEPRQFPLDSAMYKGSFQLKKQGSRYTTVVDQQVVMKFRLNTQGSYNVYGKGINAIGEFNLIGTMIMSGKTGGQVELYRTYPPERLVNPPQPKASASTTSTTGAAPAPARSSSGLPSMPPQQSLQRRESTRQVKLPSRLEDDDPSAQLSRTMEKCSQILRFIREKDVELGAFFAEPVDPIALGIPTYHQIIKEPMDIRTIYRRMEAGEINTPEEFSRLVRLVFENAMMFNIDPAHAVHQSARSLLIQFNQKFRDVERTIQNIRRAHGSDVDEKGKKKGKEDKKRKRDEPPKSLRRRRLEEAQAMAAANAQAVQAIVAAAPTVNSTTVTRSEFNMLLHHIQQLQQQIVKTHTAVAELSPGDENDAIAASAPVPAARAPSAYVPPTQSAPVQEKKKPAKRKSEVLQEPVMMEDDDTSLSLEEQEYLTETINELPGEYLGGVIQIIREGSSVAADEDEIDLEIDQLDTATQRKLLRYVQKHAKKKVKKQKKTKTSSGQQLKKSKAAAKTKAAAPKPAPAPAPAADSFFAFGSKGDSDSDSDDDDTDKPSGGPSGGKVFAPEASSEFKLGAGLGDLEEDDHDDLGSGGIAANWNIPKPATQSTAKDGGDEDDAWGAAREEAAAAKAREAERKAREEKMKAEAELTKNQRLADAAKAAEERKAQRAEEEANEARQKEKQEKEAEEARKAAREAARAQIQSVEQTVDLDAQRDIMKQYEQSFLDKDLGSASPSSDFGF